MSPWPPSSRCAARSSAPSRRAAASRRASAASTRLIQRCPAKFGASDAFFPCPVKPDKVRVRFDIDCREARTPYPSEGRTMLATKVICPNCSRTLMAATPLPVGKKVLCRQCGTTFGVQPDEGPRTPAPSRRLATAAPEPAAPPPPRGLNKGLLFGGAIAAALLLMLVGSAALIAFAIGRHRATDQHAQVSDTTPAPGANPTARHGQTGEICPPRKPPDDKTTPTVTP